MITAHGFAPTQMPPEVVVPYSARAVVAAVRWLDSEAAMKRARCRSHYFRHHAAMLKWRKIVVDELGEPGAWWLRATLKRGDSYPVMRPLTERDGR